MWLITLIIRRGQPGFPVGQFIVISTGNLLFAPIALVGGVLTLILGAWHVARRQRDRLAIPYGVAISAAGLWVLGADYLPAAQGALAG